MSAFHLLFLVPLLPLLGAISLALNGRLLREREVAVIGVGSVGMCAALTICLTALFVLEAPPGHAYTQELWSWMSVAGFHPHIALRIDSLSLLMAVVVSFVSFLIHLYSVQFMAKEEGYSRFFAWMNLFVASMLALVLADNLLFLYLGWEGVGLCSYLLIGFWYRDEANGRAARKAFIVTRIGDTALALGLIVLYTHLGTLQIQALLRLAPASWAVGSTAAVATAALLLGGAIGKSAQLPLQTWLPDAMAGPTPVSALIHAATMVTAGVYLIARTHALFSLAPVVQEVVAVLGAVTLLVSAFSALTQTDLKRILAYSTISQIGYMFLALGVGAWGAALFHFMSHAFFKALLFLGAGCILHALEDEHDIFRMGGLRTRMPVVFWTFLAGAASLAAIPFVTAGFYSKDLILARAYAFATGSPWLWAAGILGAALTSLYAFRMVFVVFFGNARREPTRRQGPGMSIPLVVLGVLSLIGGAFGIPRFLSTALPRFPNALARASWIIRAAPAFASIGGLVAAYFIYLRPPRFARGRLPQALVDFWRSGWGFDELYDRTLVRPFQALARWNARDAIDLAFIGLAFALRKLNSLFSIFQNGKVRRYAAAIAGGVVVLAALVELL